MATIEYTVEDFISRIGDGLRTYKKYFATDQFLDEEIREALYGLKNSIHWSVLRYAEQSITENTIPTVDVIETLAHFSTQWMGDEEIIERIANTSGLTDDQAKFCLQVMERIVDTIVNQGDVLRLPFVGEITASTPGRYKIKLVEGLRVKSSGKGEVVSRSATAQDQSAKGEGNGERTLKARTAGSSGQ